MFFHSDKWNNLLVFFSFAALAFIFWLLRYYQQKFEVELSIPVRYKHIPSSIILSDSLPEKINLKIQDKGTVLLNYHFSKNRDAIDIDLTDISLKQNPFRVTSAMLSSKIIEHLSATTKLISFDPENIDIYYSPLKKKKIPVVFNGDIQVASGHIFTDSIKINPSFVTIYGNSHILDTLYEIRTKPIKRSNINKKLNVYLDLQIPQGTRSSVDQVQLTADIEAYTEKTFELRVVSNNVPENLYIRFFPSTVELTCQVALSKYSQLTEKDLEIDVDYNELKHNNTSIPITLTNKPKEIINYRIIPERVEYLIEQKENL